MKLLKKATPVICVLAVVFLLLASFLYDSHERYSFKFPYKRAGLTEQQAAAHLLNRFTYGATPGQIDAVVKQGLENWFTQQLNADLPSDSLNNLLNQYDALKLSNTQIANTFPKQGQVIRMMIDQGRVNKDSVKTDRKEYRDKIDSFMREKGLRPEQELFRQFINQKVLRAAYTPNQLQEVMTDFWFNHFNVSITKNDCAQFIPDYERDVIRPNALGRFDTLLLATAKSPAMLYYLDNFTSTGADNSNANNRQIIANALKQKLLMNANDTAQVIMAINRQQKLKKSQQGLNENYAREVMELHTLGVDGGYTQQDVTNAAKVLTGWTIYPMGAYGNGILNTLNKIPAEQLAARGFVHEGDFLFTPNRHDKTEKVVLGRTFGPNNGYQEGVDLLEMLANHPSTAKFISRKIAVRFVSDNPPQTLINKMAKSFEATHGDIRQMLITMVSAPEFWSKSALREKTKSPFELAIGAVRNLNATITQPYQLYNWISRMGERKYYYQAPTGFPDRGQYWINTGSLLSRMNFGLAIAANRIPGVKIDLAALNNHHEPESSQAALATYSKIIMPERNLDETIKRLTPMLNDPDLATKVNAASANTPPASSAMQAQTMKNDTAAKAWKLVKPAAPTNNNGNSQMLAQVVGIIIGSPEYQRR
ncbi:DUF1800 domain-containing protein [Mucilaginibacter sp. RS28]|uniref:DUF1800 domain-containing protein n=1 Tax=Mucilaginibacter straminoryzae TaxID=2932774 RepID=A0A9X2B784_9SPHI|nr:DUF1800 domain-containing protein [Mucilaginibacter straminoryzae]MCJ8208259.1 DUF1800 domain-containing protein [Mucilaginibacter straminoryzae]